MSTHTTRSRRWVARISAAALVISTTVAVGFAAAAPSQANSPVSGAAFTTTNTAVDGTGHCKNGNEDVNCNIYDGKDYVWMNGGPSTAYVGDGDYFFAVLEPGGQGGNESPNDGTEHNLSDGANGAYTTRTFTVAGSTVTFNGTGHDVDGNKIRLMPYDDTSNPGGVYILAICSLADGYPVNPSDCKYDAFKIQENEVTTLEGPVPTKDADGTYDTTYNWTISKVVDEPEIKQSSVDATVNYTVEVSHDDGVVSNVRVTGTISLFNPNIDQDLNIVPITIDGITDQLSDGTDCVVEDSGAQTLTAAVTDFPYTCELDGLPEGALSNTVTVTWSAQDYGSAVVAAGSADFTFADITFDETEIDECVDVEDTYAGALGTVCVGDANPTTFTYDRDITGEAGTCTSFDNTATYTAYDTGATDSASAPVELCVGADLTVDKTATPAFTRTYLWDISKAVDKTKVTQVGGSATFNYTVTAWQTGVQDSGWAASGKVTITNPNDWEAVTVDLSDSLDDCTLDETSVEVPAGGSVDVGYTCDFAAGDDVTNTATAEWDAAEYFTPTGSASGDADITFVEPTTKVDETIHVTDSVQGALGTLTGTYPAPFASATYTYSRTVSVPTNSTCVSYDNTATITETGDTASQSVTVCGAVTGGKTMGFWQNNNGQAIIKGGSSTSNVCNSGTWLRGYAPFQDLSATATCTQVAAYATTIIKSANASGAAMNAMLKGQMLATSLDVYFSNPALGGNKIGAPAPLGGVKVDLTKVCKNIAACTIFENTSSAFGGASALTVSQLLAYAASQSNVGGSVWYAQVKATQELAKDTFDAINNGVAYVAP